MKYIIIILLNVIFQFSLTANVFDEDNRKSFIPNAKPWFSVGKLLINGNGICTGTLISPNKVITAAHCLISDKATGVGVSPEKIHFYPGYKMGSYESWSWGVDYKLGSNFPTQEFHKDWAIITLAHNLGDLYGHLVPWALGAADLPMQVSFVGYSYDYFQALNGHFQNECYIHDIKEIGYSGKYKEYYHDCDMHGGASGGPIIGWFSGKPYIVAINVAESVDPQTGKPYKDGVKYTPSTANIASGVYVPISSIFSDANVNNDMQDNKLKPFELLRPLKSLLNGLP